MECAIYFLLIRHDYARGILKLHLITILVIKTAPDSLNFAPSENPQLLLS